MLAKGKRQESRLRITVDAKLTTLDGIQRIQVCDISQRGARLQIKQALRARQSALLQWPGFEAFGQILWINDQWCGLKFDRPIRFEVLMNLRDNPRALPELVKGAEARNAARVWANGWAAC